MDPYTLMAGIGGILWFILLLLAILMPLMIYFIQRNTYQTRQELRKLNRSVKSLVDIVEQQQQQIAEAKAAEKRRGTTAKAVQAQKDKIAKEEQLVTMTCPLCGKELRYRSEHSGKKKTCPECSNLIVLE